MIVLSEKIQNCWKSDLVPSSKRSINNIRTRATNMETSKFVLLGNFQALCLFCSGSTKDRRGCLQTQVGILNQPPQRQLNNTLRIKNLPQIISRRNHLSLAFPSVHFQKKLVTMMLDNPKESLQTFSSPGDQHNSSSPTWLSDTCHIVKVKGEVEK
jgi:hypothetical protein